MRRILFFTGIVSLSVLNAPAQTTYKDVAPIFYSKCTPCHNPIGVAPMPLMNYSETFVYRKMIGKYVASGVMPPWPPDTTYHTFCNQRVLSLKEVTAIVNWVDSGAIKGDTALSVVAPVYTTKYQLHGRPDLIVKIPAYKSNASSTDAYDCFVVPTGLTQDRYIRAYEIVPGNFSIVHHAIISMDTSGASKTDTSGSCHTMPGSNVGIGGYAPGGAPVIYPGRAPLKAGFRLKAGSNIVFQIHYPAGSAGQVDSTSIRLFFYPVGTTGIREIHSAPLLQNKKMQIPPNTVMTYTAQYPDDSTGSGLTSPISLYAAFPHQHYVGESLVNFAFSGIDTIPLIRINNWNFRWQGYYTYPRLVVVPSGYKLYAEHTYNNTTSNPNNPFNPPKTIIAGPFTTNEMLLDSYLYFAYREGDDTINIQNLLQGDSLLGINEQAAFSITTNAYPNPFNNIVHIGYTINTSATVSINIYNIYGSKVRTLANHQKTFSDGYYDAVWDGKGDGGNQLPAGIYIYTITANKVEATGRIVLVR